MIGNCEEVDVEIVSSDSEVRQMDEVLVCLNQSLRGAEHEGTFSRNTFQNSAHPVDGGHLHWKTN